MLSYGEGSMRAALDNHIGDESDSRLTLLTERERQVLGLVAEGMSNSDIATRLQLTVGTVKGHVHKILAKLDVRDRTQAVVLAYLAGLTPGAHSADRIAG